MPHEVLEDTPYGGQIHLLTRVEQLDELPARGRKLVSAYQIEQFRGFPAALRELAEQTPLPSLASWLRSLAGASSCQLEVCLTEYVTPLVLIRYAVDERWQPALSFQAIADLPCETPALLRQVYETVGCVNLSGYGYSGGLPCPPDRYPDLGSYGEWREADAPDYEGFVAFYENGSGDKLLVDEEAEVGWYAHDDSSLCRLVGELEMVLPELFAALAEKRPYGPREAARS